MNSRAKLLASILFIVVIILCVGLTRFYFDVTKNTGNVSTEDKIANIIRSVGDKQIFEDEKGLCGVLDADGAILIEPEWLEIIDITDSLVLVSRRINDSVLIGGIDYEENVVLPFVYRSFSDLGEGYRLGIVDEDESCLVYTASYKPAFFRSYDSAVYEGGMLRLGLGDSIFSYYIGDEIPVLRRAELTCSIGDVQLRWMIGNPVFLNDLKENDLIRINTCVASYMDMLITSDFTDLVHLSSGDYLTPLTKPGSFTDMIIDGVGGFNFGSQDRESGIYHFAFTLSCHSVAPEAEAAGQTVQVQLFFRRSSDNSMILTSAGLDYQSTEKPVPTEAE